MSASDVPGMLDAPTSIRPDAIAGAPLVLPDGAQDPRLHKRILPWLSLIVGIAGAVTMDRGPRRAAAVAAAALIAWCALLLVHWLVRCGVTGDAGSHWRQRALVAIRQSSLMATRSTLQLGLFFALPFYWQAASLELSHAVFLLGLGLLSAATLWDPFAEWLLRRPLLGPLLPAISSFAGLNAVLPGLGLSTRASLWSASFMGGFGVLVFAISNVSNVERKRVALFTGLTCLLLPLALQLGLARLVPAAPLRLVRIAIGTQRDGDWLADRVTQLDAPPRQLFCATAIWSPIGVRDRLFHIWRRNGVERARIELDTRAGGSARSRLDVATRYGAGTYSCEVQTATGQFLGRETVEIGAATHAAL